MKIMNPRDLGIPVMVFWNPAIWKCPVIRILNSRDLESRYKDSEFLRLGKYRYGNEGE